MFLSKSRSGTRRRRRMTNYNRHITLSPALSLARLEWIHFQKEMESEAEVVSFLPENLQSYYWEIEWFGDCALRSPALTVIVF